jgi:hypothetical protein
MHDARRLVEGSRCGASEAPERALPVLLDRAFIEDTDPIVDGLAQLNLPVLPVSATEAFRRGASLADPPDYQRIAIALGAAAKGRSRWRAGRGSGPQRPPVRARGAAPARRRLAAAGGPGDRRQSGRRRAASAQPRQIGRGVSISWRPRLRRVQPAAVRVHAAGLVGALGGPAARRVVVAIAEPELASSRGDAPATTRQ